MLSRLSFFLLLTFCVIFDGSAVAQISGPYALRFGSAGAERMRDMCVDATGSYIMAFSFEQTVTFAGGTNPARTITSNGMQDSGIARYDFLGNVQWALGWGGAEGDEFPVAISCAADRSTYVAGRFTGTIDANPQFGTTSLTSNGGSDVYLIKFDPSGNFVWARAFGGSEDDEVAALSLDRDGNILLTMLYQATIDANPSPDLIAFHQSVGGKDIAFLKLNSAGNYIYSKSIGGTLDDGVDGVATVFDSAGNLVIAGTFRGTADIDPGTAPADFTSLGESDIFIARYTPAGALYAARQLGGTRALTLTQDSLGIDESDNIFLTGTFRGVVDVDLTFGVRNLSSQQNSADVFVASYTRNDVLRWSFSIGGLGTESGNSLSVDRNGILTLAGAFQGSMDVDPGSNVTALIARASNGGTDGFAAKYRANDGTFVWGYGFGSSVSGPTNATAVISNSLDTMGNLVIAGTFYGTDADFDPSPDSTILASVGAGDLFLATYTWEGKVRTPEVEVQTPVLRSNTNGASFITGGVVPGSLYTFFGLNITTKTPGIPTPDSPITLPVPTKLCNTEIIFTDPSTLAEYKAPILFCSQFQINYQVPGALPLGKFVTAKVVVDDIESNPLELLVKSDDVGLFMENFSQRLGSLVFAFGQRRGKKVTYANPITACDILEVYVTGLGTVTQGLPPDGLPAGGVRPTPGEAKVVVYDDGTKGFFPTAPRFVELRKGDGFIQYSGLTPSYVGLYQINLEWPNPAASNSPITPPLFQGDYPAYIEFSGRRSQPFILPIRYDSSNPSPCITF